MNQISGDVSQKVRWRLWASAALFVISLILSMVSFYYFHVTFPIIPLIVGMIGWLPAGVMLMSWHDLRLLKAKNSQPAQYPPQRPQEHQGKR